jgi:hypothetical protein
MNKTFHVLVVFIILLTTITSGLGLFCKTGEQPFDFENQYGDTVRIYGAGIYKNDSYFMAPILRGTDFTMLVLAIPLLIFALLFDKKHNSTKTKLFLTSIVSFFLYYSTSISFGVKYNVLHLIYSALFSCSFFAFLIGFSLVRKYDIKTSIKICTNGIKVFLILCGSSLFVAWLPDIVVSLMNGRSLELIEIYTTQITYVLDMAIISPVIFICLYCLLKNSRLGYILLGIILSNLVLIGITVINQTIFHKMAGIELPIEAIITKVGIFVVLAMAGLYYQIKLFRNIQSSGNVI